MKKTPPHIHRHHVGFTMIEVVISVSLLAMIMAVTYSSLDQIVRTKKLLEDTRDTRLIANSVLSRMTKEIQLAAPDMFLLPPCGQAQATGTTNESMRGESASIGNDRSGDKLSFMALEGGQYMPDGQTHSGIVQITYRVEKDPESNDEEAPYYLVRDEIPNLRPLKKACNQAMIFPITKNLVSLQFRYFDDKANQWVSDWTAAAGKTRLPTMVRLTLKVKSPQGRIETISTAVPLRN